MNTTLKIFQIILIIVVCFMASGLGAYFWTEAKNNKTRGKILQDLQTDKIPIHKPCCKEDELNLHCNCGCNKELPMFQG